MHLGRGALALLVNMVLGPGSGVAAVPRLRAFGWAGAALLALAGVLLTPWSLAALAAIYVGSCIDAFVTGARSPQPLNILGSQVAMVVALQVVVVAAAAVVALKPFKIPASSMYPTIVIGDYVLLDKLSPRWRPIERGEVIVFTYPCDAQRDYIKRVVALGGDTVEVRCNVVWVNGVAVPSTRVAGDCKYDDYDESSDEWSARECSRYHETSGDHAYDTFHDAERPARDAETPRLPDSRDFPPLGDHPPASCSSEADSPAAARTQVLGKLVPTKEGAPACETQLHYVVPPDHLFVLGDNRNNSNDSRVWGSVPAASVKGRAIGVAWTSGNPTYKPWSRIGAIH